MQNTAHSSSSPHGGLIVIVFFIVFFGLIGLSFYLKRKREKAMDLLARQNGWQKLNVNDPMLSNCLPPYLRDAGYRQSYDMAYQATLGGSPITFFEFIFEERQQNVGTVNFGGGIGIGIGNNQGNFGDPNYNNQQTQTNSLSVACFQIAQNYGSILIFRHYALGLGSMGHHNGMEKLNLEGDFNKFFEVYGMPGSEVETLSMLTPDMMAILEDKLKEWNVQIIGSTVYLVGNSGYIKPDKINDLLGAAEALQRQLATKPVSRTTSDNSMSVSTNVTPTVAPMMPSAPIVPAAAVPAQPQPAPPDSSGPPQQQ